MPEHIFLGDNLRGVQMHVVFKMCKHMDAHVGRNKLPNIARLNSP